MALIEIDDLPSEVNINGPFINGFSMANCECHKQDGKFPSFPWMNPLFWACALRTPTWCAHEMIRTEAETATRFASGRPGEVSKGSWKFWSAAWSVVLHPYWHSSGWCFGTYFMTFQKHLGISSSLTSCHIFQRGRSTTNQIYNVYYIYIIINQLL